MLVVGVTSRILISSFREIVDVKYTGRQRLNEGKEIHDKICRIKIVALNKLMRFDSRIKSFGVIECQEVHKQELLICLRS